MDWILNIHISDTVLSEDFDKMIDIERTVLNLMRKLYTNAFGQPEFEKSSIIYNLGEASDLIYNYLSNDTPCMIARYGATELACILNCLSVQDGKRSTWDYIIGRKSSWWWNDNIMNQMQRWSGFFPPSPDNLIKFTEMMLRDSAQMDVLAIFKDTLKSVLIEKYFPNDLKIVHLIALDPFVNKSPWSRALRGKKVLVIHPFAELIESQYQRRNKLFIDSEVLPDFKLRTIKAVQSLGGVSQGYNNWFEALDCMKSEMDKEPYDVALIGCGAYGFPLAAHAKRTSHKAVHIGGGLQLLFGIKGRRWEDDSIGVEYGLPPGFYKEIMNNSYWVRPTIYKNEQAKEVENACYW